MRILSRRRREELEVDLEGVSYLHLIERSRDRILDKAFWSALCPELSISDRPFVKPRAPYAIDELVGQRSRETLLEDGYFMTPPIVCGEEAAHLLMAAHRIAALGYPAGFAAVYDEFWRLYVGLETLLTPILGEQYRIVPQGVWLHLVPAGHPGSPFHAVHPHRDSIGADPSLISKGAPSLLTVWIALTDADPLNSCIYVLPASVDDTYLTEQRELPAEVPLQDVRALPVPMGAILGWTSHLIHWGGRSSSRARCARASASLYLQRQDVPAFGPDALSFQDQVPFEKRIHWILDPIRALPGNS